MNWRRDGDRWIGESEIGRFIVTPSEFVLGGLGRFGYELNWYRKDGVLVYLGWHKNVRLAQQKGNQKVAAWT